ncbi:MAG: hypothetical protein ACFFG0_23220 [Candidatus Thorarchaeota archaeon]
MPLSDLDLGYSMKDLRREPVRTGKSVLDKYFGRGHEPHVDYFYGFLGLVYDGVKNIDALKKKMRVLFISSTRHLVVENTDGDKYIQFAKRNKLINIEENGTITLTEKGKTLTESCYHTNSHTSYWMRIFFSENAVMLREVRYTILFF